MSPPKKPRQRLRSEYLTITLTPAERKQVSRAARISGLSDSTWARRELLAVIQGLFSKTKIEVE